MSKEEGWKCAFCCSLKQKKSKSLLALVPSDSSLPIRGVWKCVSVDKRLDLRSLSAAGYLHQKLASLSQFPLEKRFLAGQRGSPRPG